MDARHGPVAEMGGGADDRSEAVEVAGYRVQVANRPGAAPGWWIASVEAVAPLPVGHPPALAPETAAAWRWTALGHGPIRERALADLLAALREDARRAAEGHEGR